MWVFPNTVYFIKTRRFALYGSVKNIIRDKCEKAPKVYFLKI